MQADQDGFLVGSNIVNAGAEEEERRAEATATGVRHIDGNVRTIRRLLERAGPVVPSVTPRGRGQVANLTPVARVHAGDIDRIAAAARKAPVAQRGADGRFVAGSGGGRQSVAMPAARGLAFGVAGAAARIDPVAGALGELRDAVAPVGRGFMALHARLAERKKERWYSRILKAITGRKGEVAAGAGGVDVQRGSFLGTLFGELGGKLLGGLGGKLLGGLGSAAGGVLGFLGTVLSRVFLPVAAAWGAWEVGQWIGGKIYEWLDKSGVMTKIFDAFDALKGWVKDRLNSFGKGFDEQVNPTDSAPTKLPEATSFSQQAGRFMGAVTKLFKGKDSENKNRAMQTGADYAAGNIANLSDAETRALVASTAMTESSGGKLGVFNEAGYLGRYQAGASWLADAGLIKGGADSVKGAMSRDGFTNEYKWGKSGGMTRFLKDSKNWNQGLSYDAYLASADVQDLAFKDNSNAAYRSLMKSGKINKSTPTSVVAGALKARHIAGIRGAQAALEGRSGASDANGTSARRYFDDVANDRDGFGAAFSAAAVPSTASLQVMRPQAVPPSVPERVQVVQPDKVPERVSRGSEDRTVVVQKEEVGQDLRDRRAAHIVTGGIGG